MLLREKRAVSVFMPTGKTRVVSRLGALLLCGCFTNSPKPTSPASSSIDALYLCLFPFPLRGILLGG
eukprot:m.29953 g.29953  ORF g.29953 m.29953 type:complete len:67 (-) comp11992_c0_seq1:51-251(-)